TRFSRDWSSDVCSSDLPVFWNHPSVVGVTYWGYVVGQTWRNGTGLIQSNGTERPALTWLVDYVKKNPNPENKFPNFLKDRGATRSEERRVGKERRTGWP